MNPGQPSVAILEGLCRDGHARVRESWALDGPSSSGLWWRGSATEVVSTPALLRLARRLANDAERVGVVLATEKRFRQPWLRLQAARLRSLGSRGDLAGLCREIDTLGAAAPALRALVDLADAEPTTSAALELSLFGAPADQPAAAPALLRVLGASAPLVEGGQGRPAPPLAPAALPAVDPNWVAGRLLQAPSDDVAPSRFVLNGRVGSCEGDRMAWVLSTPWATLLAVLVFTMEAWAAERQGGLELELSAAHLQQFSRPPAVQVVVTLSDGREILCGTLGELCLRTLDALDMALVPALDADEVNRRLGDMIAELLRAGIWTWRSDERTRYVIGEAFGFDCYRGDGHRHIYLGAERLSQTLRGVAVTWAQSRADQPEREAAA
jgi:hypothetical protein